MPYFISVGLVMHLVVVDLGGQDVDQLPIMEMLYRTMAAWPPDK